MEIHPPYLLQEEPIIHLQLLREAQLHRPRFLLTMLPMVSFKQNRFCIYCVGEVSTFQRIQLQHHNPIFCYHCFFLLRNRDLKLLFFSHEWTRPDEWDPPHVQEDVPGPCKPWETPRGQCQFHPSFSDTRNLSCGEELPTHGCQQLLGASAASRATNASTISIPW